VCWRTRGAARRGRAGGREGEGEGEGREGESVSRGDIRVWWIQTRQCIMMLSILYHIQSMHEDTIAYYTYFHGRFLLGYVEGGGQGGGGGLGHSRGGGTAGELLLRFKHSNGWKILDISKTRRGVSHVPHNRGG
jgi:hypothetical protein